MCRERGNRAHGVSGFTPEKRSNGDGRRRHEIGGATVRRASRKNAPGRIGSWKRGTREEMPETRVTVKFCAVPVGPAQALSVLGPLLLAPSAQVGRRLRR